MEWEADALAALAQAWMQADDRNAVNTAQAELDLQLSRDPVGNGTYLHEGLYKVTLPPLTLFYSINQTERIVEVVQVQYTP